MIELITSDDILYEVITVHIFFKNLKQCSVTA